jgi:hypothetical protein
MATLYDPRGVPVAYSYAETIYDATHRPRCYIVDNETVHDIDDGHMMFWVADEWLIAPGGVPSYYFDRWTREEELNDIAAVKAGEMTSRETLVFRFKLSERERRLPRHEQIKIARERASETART